MKRSEVPSDSKPSLKTLGDRIKAVRMAWGWSQEEMAETLRVDQASISFWERDKIRPSGSALVALAALFRTSLESLEKGKGFVLPDPPSRAPISKKIARPALRSVSLPGGLEDPIAIVDLLDGTSRGRQISEAMMVLVQAVKDDRKIWIVVE
jgi:transcriptional regulator with XRE-family HTH domain